jgi:hypothetical protein
LPLRLCLRLCLRFCRGRYVERKSESLYDYGTFATETREVYLKW